MNRLRTWLQVGLAAMLVVLAAAAWWSHPADNAADKDDATVRALGMSLGQSLGDEGLDNWEMIVRRAAEWLLRQDGRVRLECVSAEGVGRVLGGKGVPSDEAWRESATTELAVMRGGESLGAVRLCLASADAGGPIGLGARGWTIALLSLWALATALGVLMRRRRAVASGAFGGAWSQERARVAQTLDFLSTGVIVIDPEGRMVFVNAAAAGMIGKTEMALRGQAIDWLAWCGSDGTDATERLEAADRADPTQSTPGSPRWRRLLANPNDSLCQRVSLVDSSGRVRTLDAACRAIVARARVLGMLLTLDDVTLLTEQGVALDQARRVADRANHAKSAFLANMSHDIRTPIHGVIGALDLLDGTGLNAGQRTFIDAASCSATALLHLINDILDFSKIEAGKLDLCNRAFNVEKCVGEAFAVAAAARGDKDIELVLDIAPLMGLEGVGDPDRIRQVIINLVSNAIKFTARGTVGVRGTAEQDSDGVRVTLDISDSGIGIPAEKLDRLFKPFSQVDVSTTREYGGTGLGLAICKQLLELMGGTIGVASTAGKGSVFTATVRLARAESETDTAEERCVDRDDLSAPLCLGCIAHEATRSAVRAVLQWAGAAFRACAGGADLVAAWANVEQGRRAVILVDVDTWSVERRAELRRMRGATMGARVVALCREAPDPANDPVESGVVDAWLVKPLAPSGLIAALRETGRDTGQVKSESTLVLDPLVAAGKRVLVAEDHPVSQMIARNYLASLGVVCEIAETGDRAVALATSSRFDAVFMDCHLPGIDGYDAARAIRAAERARGDGATRVPIIALTAGAMQGDRERCLEAGMDGFLTKPLRRIDLARNLSMILGAALVSPNGIESRKEGAMEQSGGAFDVDALTSRCMGNGALALKLLALFEERTRCDLEELSKAVGEAQIDVVHAVAHSIAGGASQVGAAAIMERAREIEHADERSPEAVLRMVKELTGEFERYIRASASPEARAALGHAGGHQR